MISGEELSSLLDTAAPMLDGVEYTEAGAVGTRYISKEEPVFRGHFPGNPVLPGVLQVAAMAQISKLCWLRARAGALPALLELERVKFRTPVLPGMTLRIECRILSAEENTMLFQVKLFSEENLVSSGKLLFGMRPAGWLEPLENAVASVQEEALLGIAEMEQYLPHRPPFLLLDGAYGLGVVNPDTHLIECRGFKIIKEREPYLSSCYPPYLLLESGAQLCCLAVLALPENRGKLGIFVSIDSARFYHGIVPGEKVDIQTAIEARGKFGISVCHFFVGETKVAECELKFAVVESQ